MNITIASMGPDGRICDRVRQAAKAASVVVVQTDQVPIIDGGFEYLTLDNIYEASDDFDTLVQNACAFLMRDKLLFIVLGNVYHNLVASALVRSVLETGGHADVIPGGDTALCAAFAGGLVNASHGVFIHTASAFEHIADTGMTLVINEIDTRLKASELKLKLAAFYDDEYPVFLVDTRSGSGKNIFLCQLDAEPSYGYYTSMVIVPCRVVQKSRFTFTDLVDVMARLRSRSGCPWDKEQTHASLKRYLVEESYEVLEAIDTDDMDALCDELGDVLLQVVFHARIAQQQGVFDIHDVTTAICNKMISRHTHIFGADTADTPQDVIKNWEQIKKGERGQQTQTDVLKSVPRSMPALMRSGKVQHKAAHIGFDFRDAAQAMDKLREEIAEVETETDKAALAEECGDLLFAAVNVIRLLGIEPETALQKATDKFISRFALVEKLALDQNLDMHQCSLDTLDSLWNEAKMVQANAALGRRQ